MPYRIRSNYFPVPNHICKPDLTLSQLKVLLFLLSWLGKEDSCYFGISYIASQIGFSEKQVDRAISELSRLGFITVESGKKERKPNRYIVNVGFFASECLRTPQENALARLKKKQNSADADGGAAENQSRAELRVAHG